MRVLFWGTPEFATPPLRALLGEGFDVVGVVTQPDKPVGRSRSTVQAPPVKEIALADGIPVLQPARPRGEEFLAQLRALEPDISVVVAYGLIAPLGIVGCWRLLRSGRATPLLLLAASVLLTALVFFPQERFRIPILDPTLIVGASVLLAGVATRR